MHEMDRLKKLYKKEEFKNANEMLRLREWFEIKEGIQEFIPKLNIINFPLYLIV